MTFEIENPQFVLLNEVNNKEIKQKDIAKTYALAIKSGEPIDWKVVNAAIIERWSRSGLNRIKTMAWSL